jgi:hypothetical protein
VIPIKAKTAPVRTIPMSDNLFEWLATYRNAMAPVAPKKTKKYAERLAEKTRADAGITNWGDERANTLRHSFSLPLRAGR